MPADYEVDSIPKASLELKGGSAEGVPANGPMKGYGRLAILTRKHAGQADEGGANPPGAFIKGGNDK